VIDKIYDDRMQYLDKEVFYCKKCVNSNQRHGLIFDENGVCDACRYNYEKDNIIDWEKREKELRELTDLHRSKDGSFDVIVPASGGKDSCYVAHQLKYVYGMHPLCVTWAPAMYTDIGWENVKSFVNLFDTTIHFPNRHIHGKLSRLGFELYGDTFEPWHCGMKAFPLHMAIKYKIPLIFYGEKTGVEYGGMTRGKESPLEIDVDREVMKKLHRLDILTDEGMKHGIFNESEIEEKSLEMYNYPSESIINEMDIQVNWFSYYKKWIPKDNYFYAQKHCGFETNQERTEGTYSKYASLDDKIDDIHFYMQYIKLGFGRCTSEASQEIRSGIITREEGIELVHKYDGEFPEKYFNECLDYMDITEEHFYKVVDKFRLPHLWEKKDGEWRLRHKVS